MIQEFLDTWSLFQYSYLEGWVIAWLLSLIGVLVVARDQIFLGAAVSQASMVGIAVALHVAAFVPAHEHAPLDALAGDWLHSDGFQMGMAAVFSVLAALATGKGTRTRADSHEAVTGWVFLLSGALAILIVARSPHGLEEIHRVHSSSIIGATPAGVWGFAAFALATTVVALIAHPRLLLFATDASMAAAVGMNVRRWSLALSLWLGLAIGLAIQASGMLYTFGMLVLPALIAKNLCREVRPMLLVSPIVALAAAAVGFVLANHLDFPPAQMTVALLGMALPLAWLRRRFRR